MSNRTPSTPASWSSLSDLVVVGSLGVWTAAVALVGGDGGLVRMALGIPAVLFAPGYAFVAALFPRRRRGSGVFPRSSAKGGTDDSDDGDGEAIAAGGVTVVERLLIAVGTSVCLVPLIGLSLHVSRVGIRPTVFLGAIGTATVASSAIAALRRFLVPPDERFVPRLTSAAAARERLRADGGIRDDGVESVLTLLLAVGLVVAVAGMGFAAIDTDRGERFTEFYLTTEDPDTGESVAGGYPEEIPPGESDVVQVGIANHEGETEEYAVAVYVESFDESGEVEEAHLLEVATVTVEHGETVELDHELEPAVVGEDLKVSYHLYRGTSDVPETPREEAAYRNTHIWVDVPESEGADG